MIFIRLLRLLCGYVEFYAENGFTERFINLCSLRGIPLWNLNTNAGRVFACTTLAGYLQIRECAVKSGMRLHHTKAVGLPFFARKYRRRAGVLCGLGVFFTVIGMLSAMVWTIDITDNSIVSDEEILAVLEEAGLKPGVFKSSINAPEIRFYALSRLPEVTYLTVNILGSCVHVEVTERIERPDIPSDETPCDIVSTVDGQLAVLEIYEGTKIHSVGEAVSKGETLVGGFAEFADGSLRFMHATAYAVLRTQITVSAEAAHQDTAFYRAKTQKHITLHIFGIDIPLYIKSDTKPNLIRSSYLTANGKRLPIGYTEKVYTQFSEKKITQTDKKLMLSTAEKYFENKIEALGGAVITNEKITVNNSITGEFTAEVSAGAAQQMLIEEQNNTAAE